MSGGSGLMENRESPDFKSPEVGISAIVETFRLAGVDQYEDVICVFAKKKIDIPKSFSFPFVTRKVTTIIFIEGGQALSRF